MADKSLYIYLRVSHSCHCAQIRIPLLARTHRLHPKKHVAQVPIRPGDLNRDTSFATRSSGNQTTGHDGMEQVSVIQKAVAEFRASVSSLTPMLCLEERRPSRSLQPPNAWQLYILSYDTSQSEASIPHPLSIPLHIRAASLAPNGVTQRTSRTIHEETLFRLLCSLRLPANCEVCELSDLGT